MKIFASNLFTPIKSLSKTAKIAVLTLPLAATVEGCSSCLYPPPPPPPYPYHYPHPHPHRHFCLSGALQPEDTMQYIDTFELNNKDIAYIDNIEQNNEPKN